MKTLEDFGAAINDVMAGQDSAIAKDLRLNLKRVLLEGSLSEQDMLLALLSTATSAHCPSLVDVAQRRLQTLGVDEAIIKEAVEAASLTGMLNVYYRFRHFIENTQGSEALERYRSVGLRMNAMSKPVMGHRLFEMLAFSVSVLNGCEMCVNGHEKRLLDLDVAPDAIHDLARMAALVKATADFSSVQYGPLSGQTARSENEY